ncbi:type I-MYXAN CRISPR-associated protein Cas5/Cmx5/DevS [Microcystis aeruginosa BLCCF158]|jgi:CRISPR-associated protein Cas5t|uniref:Type I-MYXAN CRISPR-associated protein Cas5/Cmx5/DevS n=1 Tax=Microcystis aeruginosa BLCC-F158 TaxID=2755316 RepID=A0A841UWD5_MICAE|nr:type I-MYXAN CRISPR-associated protein Cas5/Cmx5/DevS [Microcystis aeruginosa]MBC1194408.1 type I-MYXAN CRISPR-associated protein Cas5/Cmx5/DevS [Microcystis aeruginosa BLCC-F158]
MDCLWLRIRAPFAAFRGFQAGVYRSTSPVMPPSAALGLLLNLAGIEMRDYTAIPNLLIRGDIPCLQLAIATLPNSKSEVCTLYQQLHSYPVGDSGKTDLKPRTQGAKYWITPVRRELLVGLDMILGVQASEQLLERIKKGLKGELDQSRYGLPFAGDNNFLFDRIDILTEVPEVFWYVQMQPDDPPMRGSYRLTVGIDRADNSKTISFLFAPVETPSSQPPDNAWIWTPRKPLT